MIECEFFAAICCHSPGRLVSGGPSHFSGGLKQLQNDHIRTFEDLECWKACRELRMFVAKEVVPTLPKEERFGLAAQLLDAAHSTTANARPIK